MPANSLKVDRTTRWGNPFRVGHTAVHPATGRRIRVTSRAMAVELFARWLRTPAGRALAKEARHRLTGVMDGIDALVLPAATGEAPQGLGSTGDATFSLFWSLLGPPCATIPGATGAAGLPIGVQFVGRFGHDEELLALTEWAAERLI